ncbi:T9SS type A sorting domain-containing protein [bacterium]|nr:T9SS type A sorting domain-containing protein [bacterium]MBU1881188.1 T9SS type A sorting domain-containing protein [bacterium]
MIKKSLWILVSLVLLSGLSAWAASPGDVVSNKIAVKNPTVPAIPDPGIDEVDSVIFSEDFESGQGDWTFVDVTAAGIQWHADSFNAYAGNSWWCGDPALGGYDNHWLQYLVSPSLDFSSVTNPVLTFKMFYAVEAPGGEPAPYDGWDGCNVWASINGGATWVPIMPTLPAYTCTSMYSFGFEWGMGPNIPGWGAASGGWVDAEFNLSAAIGRPDVKIRFAFCSDPAYCTIDDPSLLGFFVDDVSIDDGATNLLSNDADGVAFPSDFTFDTGESSGDFWTMTTQSSHSATNSMLNDHEGHYNLSDALVSPWIEVPEDVNVKFRFWLWCNMLDFDGDGNNSLEDYYHVEVSTDGVVWEAVFYDYGDITRPGGALFGWDWYEPGDPFNGNIQLSLSAYGGQEVKLRWRVITDDNDDGGIGDGLYIDDVEVFIAGFDNDVGTERFNVPFPTSAYLDNIPCSVELHNYGNVDQGMVQSYWRINQGTPNPLIPWASIPVLSYVTKEWNWLTPNPGSYILDVYTALASDEDTSNDTSYAGTVEVTTADVLEFGYDTRRYSYEPSVYYFNFSTGQGAYVRYTPLDDGVVDPMNGQYLKALFQDTGTIRIHIYEGGETAPGAPVDDWDANVTMVAPNWQTFDISQITFFQEMNDDFWVWYEVLNTAGTPHIMGWDENVLGEEHFFANFSGSFGVSDYEFFARAVFEPAVGVSDPINPAQPAEFALHQNTPNPFNPSTTIEFSLAKAGMAKITVFDLMGRQVATLVDGNYAAGLHNVTFNAANLASGVYIYRLEADNRAMEKKMLFLK